MDATIKTSDGSMAIPISVERKTETELKLSEFERKRGELMGQRSSVERQTRISLVMPAPRSANDAEPKGKEPDSSHFEGEEDDSMSMRYMMKRFAGAKRGAEGEDTGPLTTKALRDLLKIQKEVVYSQTLINIR